MTDMCPLDGSVRIRKSADGAEWWECPWCRGREQIETDPIRAALQREYDR